MTKRDRLSFALRRLRTVKNQDDTALRIQKTHDLVKEFIDELSKGTKNSDLGEHTIQLLDDLYAQNTGAIEDGRLPAPPPLPDCSDEIYAKTQALQALASEDESARRSQTAAILRDTLSLFALGPNEAPLHAFLDAVDAQVKEANERPISITDYTEQLQRQTDDLPELDGVDDPDHVRESAVSMLTQTLSVFAHGPNEKPVKAVLGKVKKTMKQASVMSPLTPDYAARLQPHVEALEALTHQDEPEAPGEAEVAAVRGMLLAFAEGPNEKPIRTALAALEALDVRKANELQAVEPEEEPEEVEPPFVLDPEQLKPHIEALAGLEGLDDPDVVTAAAAMALYEALADMAQGPQEASIRALLDVFDQVTGAV